MRQASVPNLWVARAFEVGLSSLKKNVYLVYILTFKLSWCLNKYLPKKCVQINEYFITNCVITNNYCMLKIIPLHKVF